MRRAIVLITAFILGALSLSGCGGEETYTIYFQSDRGGNWDIYSIQHDGTAETQITDDIADDMYPAVSADGSKLAFIRRSGNATDIILFNMETEEETNLTNGRAGGTVESITWYPDGERLLLTRSAPGIASGRPQLYWMGEEGIAADETGMNLLGQNTAYSYWNPRVNADGEQIVVTTGHNPGFIDVHILESGGGFKQVVPHETFLRPTGDFRATGTFEDYPQFGPNGRDIILQSNARAETNPDDAVHLWYVTSQGRRSTDRTPNAQYNNMQPAWSSVLGGSTIVFVSDREGSEDIYLWNLNEEEAVRLTDNPANESNPSWLSHPQEDE